MSPINPAHQLVILARLQEFCEFHTHTMHQEKDPWGYMRRKLLEIEEPLTGLKQELFDATKGMLLQEMRSGKINDERFTDYRALFEKLLSQGDFADIAIHLSVAAAGPAQIPNVLGVLKNIKPTNFFQEEKKPPPQRSAAWEKLVKELSSRLDIDLLDKLLARKPRTNLRKRVVLRRLRGNVAHYCAVLHIPTDPNETFTPFMLPRVEAVVAASLRFLNKYR